MVRPVVSTDTVNALEILLAEARAGQLIGLAYVGLYPGRAYVADTAGEAQKAPIFTSGLLAILDYQLVCGGNPAA